MKKIPWFYLCIKKQTWLSVNYSETSEWISSQSVNKDGILYLLYVVVFVYLNGNDVSQIIEVCDFWYKH